MENDEYGDGLDGGKSRSPCFRPVVHDRTGSFGSIGRRGNDRSRESRGRGQFVEKGHRHERRWVTKGFAFTEMESDGLAEFVKAAASVNLRLRRVRI